MAKRHSKPKKQFDPMGYLREHRGMLWKLAWVFIVAVSILFGYSNGYPLVVQGRLLDGILIGTAYGAGAFAAILAAIIVNRKLKGS